MAAINNVTRMLDSQRIAYSAIELPDAKLGALETARLLEVEPDLVFKTIVVKRVASKGPILVLLAGTTELDLKKVAAAMGEKKVQLPTEREAEELTGLQAGGISPLALINKGFRVLIDSSAQQHAEIHVSGGQRGLNIRLSVSDLVRLTNARFASVAAGPDANLPNPQESSRPSP